MGNPPLVISSSPVIPVGVLGKVGLVGFLIVFAIKEQGLKSFIQQEKLEEPDYLCKKSNSFVCSRIKSAYSLNSLYVTLYFH